MRVASAVGEGSTVISIIITPGPILLGLQELENEINTFAGRKGVIIHDIKYEKIQQVSNVLYLFRS